MTKLDYALLHALRGWAVFPLIPNAKLPAKKGWHSLATTNEHQIRSWWGENPDYNIGIATGRPSDLCVLDVDYLEPFQRECPVSIALTDHYSVSTPSGGYHIYFKGTGYKNSVKKIPGADIRCEGGYVVAAGSIIDDSKYEEWKGQVAVVPFWLNDYLASTAPKSTNTHVETFPEGSRNNSLTAAAGALQRSGLLTLNTLLALNQDKCSPPLDESEVELIYSSISSYEVTSPIKANPDDMLPYVRASDLADKMQASLTDKTKIAGEATLIDGLDRLLGGGLRQGELVVLNAVAKTGKSSLFHQIIRNLNDKNIAVGYASREMRPADEVLPNMLSIEFEENAWKEELSAERLEKYFSKLSSWPLYFAPGYGAFALEEYVRWVTALKAVGVNHFFIDHLHASMVDPGDHDATVIFAQGLKKLALDMDVCIVAIIQPTKIYEGMTLGLQTIRGGAGVGQTLDVLLTLERYVNTDGTKSEDISVLAITDIRHKLGRTGRIFLQYNQETTKLKEVKQVRPEVKNVEKNIDEKVVSAMARAVS